MKLLKENGMYAVVADPGMAIAFADGYCHKLYRKTDDFSDCTEVEQPIEEEQMTDSEALAIIVGGSV